MVYRSNQLTGFYVIGTSAMKELNVFLTLICPMATEYYSLRVTFIEIAAFFDVMKRTFSFRLKLQFVHTNVKYRLDFLPYGLKTETHS